jgi:hypothetical protein
MPEVPEHRCASRKGCSGTDIHRPRPSPTILPAQILKWLDGTTTGRRVWVTGHRYPPRARDRRSRAMQRLFYPYGSRPHRRRRRRALYNTLQECRLTTSGPPRLGFRLAGVGRCPESALSRPSSGQTAGLCRHPPVPHGPVRESARRNAEALVRAAAVRHRLSPDARRDLAANIAAAMNSIDGQLFPGDPWSTPDRAPASDDGGLAMIDDDE